MNNPTDQEKEVAQTSLAQSIEIAWSRYTVLFGEPPHGLFQQIMAMLELMPDKTLFRDWAVFEKKVAKKSIEPWERLANRALEIMMDGECFECGYEGGEELPEGDEGHAKGCEVYELELKYQTLRDKL